MTGNSLDDWTENLKRKSEKELGEWIIDRQKQNAALTDLMDQYVLLAYRTTVDGNRNNDDTPGPACSPAERVRRHHTEP